MFPHINLEQRNMPPHINLEQRRHVSAYQSGVAEHASAYQSGAAEHVSAYQSGVAEHVSAYQSGVAEHSSALNNMQIKTHRPPHYYVDNQHYFLTSSTYQKKLLFNTNEKLNFIQNQIQELTKIYAITLEAWAILPNHYHLLFVTSKGQNLSYFIKRLHSNISIYLNKIDKTPNRKVWYQYWDRCIRSEKDYYTRLNYIHNNCIKHGLSKNIENYNFSSYKKYLNDYGIEWISDCFSAYPIIDFTPEFNDDF